jgi:lipopolysaccharide export system protein LptC
MAHAAAGRGAAREVCELVMARTKHPRARAARLPRLMLSTTRLFPLGVMLALALLTFYLERTVREEDAPPVERRHDPDYFVVNFTTTTYNGEGAVESIMSAQRMVHYPDDDTTELFAPRVVQAKPHEPRFSVRAERGQLSRDGDEIFLYGDVLLCATPPRSAPRRA